MSNVAETIQGMKSKFNASAAAGLDLVFQFNITDADDYYLIVKDGTCDFHQGESADANVTLIMDSETMQGVISGETDGMQAFMAGKLRAEGDMMLALKLSELFPA
ncbi:SCP2 sterol-binding domain-containing protein [Stutzerimonas nitrititolerans]|uniref:SCP-2 family sterol carrier protein n=1 Tax=Stutzerimonas nitrititolerans TaxID=2482751 RepID=A0AA41WIM3_9GAMM|nr:SCP2 sterol-binding domain-containing protein [Stutzerimonas nitrititolerans]AFN78099.1 SCP-2 sterol transfer family protein [Stutzerimonas stutzeri DSM 10701]KRW69768.1 SCP-2 family sterol carrier protein [Pseudomonas sp. TTU2014-096BSC]KRW73439.1 SCP-2 family sterol carrier protein [Pseudomonas sp. TTU2014-066ASC]MBA1184576.1 SCP2 sterol-binding domain-containing protein [Stutzerimonas stutzeri]OCX15278.1 SCP-2 family sterol carrier protein [Stutzerimonas xanthomarina]RRV26487.1 SCP-2 fa